MKSKHMFLVFVVLCSVICKVYSTPILLENLKTKFLDGRCKLHEFGTKLIHHEHHHGDPCLTSKHAHEHPSSTAKEDIDWQPLEVTSEAHPSSKGIDIRVGQDGTTNDTEPSSSTETHKDEYVPVPEGGGKNLIRVGCNVQIQTGDECLEEI